MAPIVIVVPCYNEQERLPVPEFLESARSEPGYRFLFVDDGSTDGTLGVLEGMRREAPEGISILHLPENQGKGEAVRRGVLEAAQSEPAYIGYWDADLATPLEAIQDLAAVLDTQPQTQMVFGSRVSLLGRDIDRRWWRHYLGRIYATAASNVLALPIYDTQCGAKLMRATPQIVGLFEEPFMTRWLFDIELIARLTRQQRTSGGPPAAESIYEFPLNAWRDVPGSKVTARDGLCAAWELWRIYQRYTRGRR